VSHQPERKEKDCLNCGTIVQGRYCQVCGQENIEPKESFFSLVKHFVYDILHFDGKFFDTLKYILFRPGFISKQYVQGKRMRFLHPIRMYLFTSAVFFVVFFSTQGSKLAILDVNNTDRLLTNEERREEIADVNEDLAKTPGDTALLQLRERLLDTTKPMKASELFATASTPLVGFEGSVKTVQQYDSVQRARPSEKRDGWMMQRFKRKLFALNAKYSGRSDEGFKTWIDLFVHKLPYLLFISLPFHALLLKLLYIRRKTFYYSDHAVFTLHQYIFSFILLLIVFFFNALHEWSGLKLFQYPIMAAAVAWPVYSYLSMKNFYSQGWIKTFSKFLLLNLLAFLVLLLLFILFFFFTLFQL
jgi:hypothetical protein